MQALIFAFQRFCKNVSYLHAMCILYSVSASRLKAFTVYREKRFYTRETIRVSQLAEINQISTLFHDRWRSLKLEKG